MKIKKKKKISFWGGGLGKFTKGGEGVVGGGMVGGRVGGGVQGGCERNVGGRGRCGVWGM